jgi:hypothetical protein
MVVEMGALPQNGTSWRSARGCVGLWVPSPSVLVFALHGYGDAGFAAPIIRAYETLANHGSLYVFADAEALVNYDSALRTQLTSCFFPDRERIASLHVLFHSKIVAMGISVVNLALGGIVTTTTERARFKAKLDACLFENHTVGFSSNALDALRFSAA